MMNAPEQLVRSTLAGTGISSRLPRSAADLQRSSDLPHSQPSAPRVLKVSAASVLNAAVLTTAAFCGHPLCAVLPRGGAPADLAGATARRPPAQSAEEPGSDLDNAARQHGSASVAARTAALRFGSRRAEGADLRSTSASLDGNIY
jgi:hypothetical protein